MAVESAIGRLLTAPELREWPRGPLRSAFVIDVRWVLTAWHCLPDGGGADVRLWLRLHHGDEFVDVPVRHFAHDPELDVALLAVEGRYDFLAGIALPLGREVAVHDRVRAGGFPERNPATNATTLAGTVESPDAPIGRYRAIRVHVEAFGARYPELPDGMSGGPLLRPAPGGREVVVGVVVSYPKAPGDMGATGGGLVCRSVGDICDRFEQIASLAGGNPHRDGGPAVDRLADSVRRQWQNEIGVRHLYEPAPIDVPWSVEGEIGARHPVDSPRGILALFPGRVRQQLVILGEAGSGKTTLALHLVSQTIARREPGDPVPVLVSLSGWRPREVPFAAWLAERIDETSGSRTMMTADVIDDLHRSGLLIPVLDGLDEMAADDRAEALGILTSLVGDGSRPLVLTCRSAVYRALRNRPPRALTITLQPISVGAALEFLTRRDSDDVGWRAVADRMTADQDGPIARALTLPLMVWLAREVYVSQPSNELPDPEELLEAPTRDAVEDRLLSRLLPALYAQPPDRRLREKEGVSERYAHGLFHRVARHLTGEHSIDIRWWTLYTLVPMWARMVLVTLAVYLSASVGVAASWAVPSMHPVAPVITLAAAAFGPYLGVGVALAGPPGRPTRLGVRARADASGFRALPSGFLIGALVGALSGVLGWALSGDVPFAAGLFLLGAVIGGVFTLFESPDVAEAATPGRLHAVDRTAFWALAVVGVLATAAGGAIVGYLTGGFSATVCGAWAGGVCGVLVGAALGRRVPRIPALAGGVLTGVALGWLVGLLAGGGVYGPLTTAATGASLGLCLGVVTGLASTSAGWLVLTEVYLALSFAPPRRRLLTVLDGAHRRGLLRCEGAMYQFRHQRLQSWFANQPGR